MVNTNSIAVKQKITDKLQIKEIVFVLAFSILLQILIHLIPSGNTPIGATLLPIFYAPFIAVLFFRVHVGLIVGLLSPLCNYLITGKPAPELIGIMSLELIIFVLLTKLFSTKNIIEYVNAPISYLLTKVISLFAILLLPVLYSKGNSWSYLTNSIQNSVVGILALFVINYFAVKLYQKIKK